MLDKIKNINWGKVGWVAFNIFVVLALNSALLFYFISTWISYQGGEFTYWEVLTIKYVSKVSGFDLYHWYNKPLTILGVMLGGILSFIYVKWVVKLHIDKKRDERQADILDKKVERIMEGK